MFPTNSVEVKGFGGLVCIFNSDLAIWKVFFDHSMVPATGFIRGCLIPFDIDGCIDRREAT